jgi:hypothetical protein
MTLTFNTGNRPTEPGTHLVRLTPEGEPQVACIRRAPCEPHGLLLIQGGFRMALCDVHERALWSEPLEWVNAVNQPEWTEAELQALDDAQPGPRY